MLDAKQIAVFAEFAKCKTYTDGDFLFRAGETDFMFHVIKSGAIEIVDRSSGVPRTMLVHEPGEFTGDLSNLTVFARHFPRPRLPLKESLALHIFRF